MTKMDEPGQAYFIVVADGAAAPTNAQVEEGADYGGVAVAAKCGQAAGEFDMPIAGDEYSCSVAGLMESTAYDVYVVTKAGGSLTTSTRPTLCSDGPSQRV